MGLLSCWCDGPLGSKEEVRQTAEDKKQAHSSVGGAGSYGIPSVLGSVGHWVHFHVVHLTMTPGNSCTVAALSTGGTAPGPDLLRRFSGIPVR